MNRLEFSCFANFFVCIFKTRVEYGFPKNLLVEGTVNSMEQTTRVFCQIAVQEFHLCTLLIVHPKKHICLLKLNIRRREWFLNDQSGFLEFKLDKSDQFRQHTLQ